MMGGRECFKGMGFVCVYKGGGGGRVAGLQGDVWENRRATQSYQEVGFKNSKSYFGGGKKEKEDSATMRKVKPLNYSGECTNLKK